LVAGATSANVAAATAYIADVSPEGDRSRLFGLVGATFGAGFVIGPALGGLAGSFDLRLPFMIAAGLSFANFCFGIFVLPESLEGQNRRAFDWSRANPIRQLLSVVHNRELGRLALAWSCTWVGLGAVQSSLVLFTAFRFHWGAGLNGLVLAGVGLSQALVEGLLLRHVTAWLGERRTAMLGYSAGVVGYATLALAIAGWMIVPAVMLIALGGLATPSVRSMVAGKGDADTQGEMQGLLASVESLTAVVAPLLAAGLFFAFTSKVLPVTFPGAPFILAATFAALGAALMRMLKTETPAH
jgi:DHA1 family tetracycline resistance protein-like MFS transporter